MPTTVTYSDVAGTKYSKVTLASLRISATFRVSGLVAMKIVQSGSGWNGSTILAWVTEDKQERKAAKE